MYRPSTASNLILSQQLKNEYDERMSTNIPNSSVLKSSSPKIKVGQSSFKNIFQKVPEASSSKATALISNSSWTAPIINSSPIPINLFVPKTHNQDFEEENIIHDFDHGESQKVYAPVAHSHNEVHEHEASEKGTREIFVYIYICVIYNSATINIFIKSHFSWSSKLQYTHVKNPTTNQYQQKYDGDPSSSIISPISSASAAHSVRKIHGRWF